MKIYDCFTFNNENDILEVRLNELDEYVDFFVIIEFGITHQGNYKGKKINSNLINKFKKKIKYFYFENFKKNLNAWERESFQRNQINEGLRDTSEQDVILISDVDEIPNLKKFDFKKIDDYVFAFSQTHSMYKFNLLRNDNWIGTKLCKKKILKSPQWLRSLKVKKKYSFFRIDKYFSKTYYKKFKIIDDGGWHFGWLMNLSQILEKINSYAHTEHNIPKFKNKSYIEDCIDKNVSFLDLSDKLTLKKEINFLPNYIQKNKEKFSLWIKKR